MNHGHHTLDELDTENVIGMKFEVQISNDSSEQVSSCFVEQPQSDTDTIST